MNPELEEAIRKMEESGTIVYPTETAYGIGCNALDEEAVEKVYRIKKRPRSKGLTVICSSMDQVKRYAKLNKTEEKLAEEFMPGPLTLVVEKKETVPDELNEKFVFRISSAETARELAGEFPIVATSANISGGETSYSVEEISDEIKMKVDHVLDEGHLDEGPTSTIAEVTEDGIEVHREGPITLSELENSLLDEH